MLAFTSTAMGMPQKEAYEKLIFGGDQRQASVSFLIQGRTNLIHLKEPWNVAGLLALTFWSEPIPTQAGKHISSTVH
jgi:hypothetical protein